MKRQNKEMEQNGLKREKLIREIRDIYDKYFITQQDRNKLNSKFYLYWIGLNLNRFKKELKGG